MLTRPPLDIHNLRGSERFSLRRRVRWPWQPVFVILPGVLNATDVRETSNEDGTYVEDMAP